MKKILFIIVTAITMLAGCTNRELYGASVDLWCNYHNKAKIDPENQPHYGKKIEPLPEKCTYLSYEAYQKKIQELDEAVEEQKRKANM